LRLPVSWLLTAVLSLWVLHAGVSPEFTPVRSELTNARGFSRGILNLVILPASAPFQRAPAPAYAGLGLLFLALATVDPRIIWQSRFARVMNVSGIAVLTGVALSPWLSPYRVVLAPRTFVLLVAMVSAARTVGVVIRFGLRWTPVAVGLTALAFAASAMLQTLDAYGGNYSGFLHMSREVADRAPFLEERPDLRRSLIVYDGGYDGQFMYLMAFDPFLRRFADRPQEYRAVVDDPPYRYGRIGFSVLTRLVSFGRAERFPAAMLWLIVAAHFALATLLASFAAARGRSPAMALWYLAIPGFMSSLLSALPEALAAAGIVAGFVAWRARRRFLAATAFGASLLVRETGIVLLIALALTHDAQDEGADDRPWMVVLAAATPVVLWRLFAGARLYPEFGVAAYVPNPGDFGIPFAGLLQLWFAGLSGTQPASEIGGAIAFPVILAGTLVLALALLTVRRGALEAAIIAYALIGVSLNYAKIWSHLPSGERGTFELFLCALLLLIEGTSGPRWLRPVLTGLFAVLLTYTFLIAPDAATSRAALLLIR
jgi:hypothetical protein